MLSFIVRLVRDFELEHGFQPNLLYLNRLHFGHLNSAFDASYSMTQILDCLGMKIIIENDITHPRVAWRQLEKKVAAV